ncbi:MAG TPA: phytochelatin synthase family protein [Polyangiales bacterium]|nr:phytochelatin synthase family protein [Polyangiales bacterium]
MLDWDLRHGPDPRSARRGRPQAHAARGHGAARPDPRALPRRAAPQQRPAPALPDQLRRKPIFGAGPGHHSPLAGYLEPEDLVFVLDVNSDFGPWLIASDKLYTAIDTLDGDKKRGLLRLEAR